MFTCAHYHDCSLSSQLEMFESQNTFNFVSFLLAVFACSDTKSVSTSRYEFEDLRSHLTTIKVFYDVKFLSMTAKSGWKLKKNALCMCGFLFLKCLAGEPKLQLIDDLCTGEKLPFWGKNLNLGLEDRMCMTSSTLHYTNPYEVNQMWRTPLLQCNPCI